VRVRAYEHYVDAIADAIALVEATGRDDLLGAGAILRNCDHPAVTVMLAKLMAELVSDNVSGRYVCAECFRSWAAEAITRA
jgi:hypothetical protein